MQVEGHAAKKEVAKTMLKYQCMSQDEFHIRWAQLTFLSPSLQVF